MAHYAELDTQNRVIRVVVIDNQYDTNEATGIAYCQQLFKGGVWIKTSYNSTIRKNFAVPGSTYHADKDAFITPRPFKSWQLNDDCKWIAPIAYPTDGKAYYWHEGTLNWREDL